MSESYVDDLKTTLRADAQRIRAARMREIEQMRASMDIWAAKRKQMMADQKRREAAAARKMQVLRDERELKRLEEELIKLEWEKLEKRYNTNLLADIQKNLIESSIRGTTNTNFKSQSISNQPREIPFEAQLLLTAFKNTANIQNFCNKATQDLQDMLSKPKTTLLTHRYQIHKSLTSSTIV